MTKPLVSVITIFLNGEKFLKEAVDSVIAQTYENWELLLIDDGSTDRSSEIALEHARDYPERIKYYEHDNRENRGKSISRNLGISHASGDYLAFLDADDMYLPGKLEHQVSVMEACPDSDMIYGPTLYWSSWKGNRLPLQKDCMGKLGVEEGREYTPPELLTRFLNDGGIVPCICSLLVRSKLVKELGGFDEAITQLYEDQVLLAKICMHSKVVVDGQCHDWYRQHSGSSSYLSIVSGEYHPVNPNEARRRFLYWLEDYAAQQGIVDADFRKSLELALNPYRSSCKNGMSKRHVDFGDLRRTLPFSREYGFDRGKPIDRYYIEKFLDENRDCISGRVLEVGDDSYTKMFSGSDITSRDVLNIDAGAPGTTIAADLENSENIPSDSFDCFIMTQTLQLIYDTESALKTVYRILKPGGTVLATFPGITQVSNDQWANSWFWSFTAISAGKLFGNVFPREKAVVRSFGNVFAATAFLYGLSLEETDPGKLDYHDPEYEVIIAVRAEK